jgi:hypothetical protein
MARGRVRAGVTDLAAGCDGDFGAGEREDHEPRRLSHRREGRRTRPGEIPGLEQEQAPAGEQQQGCQLGQRDPSMRRVASGQHEDAGSNDAIESAGSKSADADGAHESLVGRAAGGSCRLGWHDQMYPSRASLAYRVTFC